MISSQPLLTAIIEQTSLETLSLMSLPQVIVRVKKGGAWGGTQK